MCGLFGFSGWDKANLAKLKLLGLYNKTRGRDSCGYYFNDKLVKGVGLKKEWDDFIEEEIIDAKGKSNVFIGHCRQGTVGASTIENAHPFDIKGKMILAHNGTLDNHWEMLRNYDIPSEGINVDSLALGHLLLKIGAKQILQEYRGYAALLIHLKNEPDSLFVYHGASKVFESDDKLTEERPLFMMKTPEGIYFSSMIKSLQAIRGSITEVPMMVPHNQLIKVTNGRLAKSWMHVDRGSTNIGLEKKNQCGVHYQKNAPNSSYPVNQRNNHFSSGKTTPTMGAGGTNSSSVPFRTSPDLASASFAKELSEFTDGKDIWLETKPVRCFQPDLQEFDFLYCHKGRYHHTDGNDFAEDIVYCDARGVVYDGPGTKIQPFYFYRGVKLKSKEAFEEIQRHIKEKDYEGQALLYYGSHNFAQTISRYSSYPVTNLQDEGKNTAESARKMWWFDYKPASGAIQPVWSDRNYVYGFGNLKDIVPTNIKKGKKDVCFVPAKNATGADLWVNKEWFLLPEPVEQQSLEFENGEIILKDEDNKEIGAVTKWFDKTFDSIDIALSDAPALVWDALGFYVVAIMSTRTYTPDDEEVAGLVDKFVTLAIQDNVTFRENMESGHEPHKYVKMAYTQEASGAYKGTKRILEELEEINLQWKEISCPIEDEKKKTTNKTQEKQMEILALPPSTTEQQDLNTKNVLEISSEIPTMVYNDKEGVYTLEEAEQRKARVIQMETRDRVKSESEKEVENVTSILRFMNYMDRKSMTLSEQTSNPFTLEMGKMLKYSVNVLTTGLKETILKNEKTELEILFRDKCPRNTCD